jgi:hypothetical protein
VSAADLSESARTSLVVDVSVYLTSKRNWRTVALHIAEDTTWLPVSDALRRASTGDRDALGEIEALALSARDAVAKQIVDRYLAGNPQRPYAPARLLAKYPSGQIPQTELLHALQLEYAA